MIQVSFRWDRRKIWELLLNEIPHLQVLEERRLWQVVFFFELCETGENAIYVQVFQFLDALGVPNLKSRGMAGGGGIRGYKRAGRRERCPAGQGKV